MSASRKDMEVWADWTARGLPVKNTTPAVLVYYDDFITDTSHLTDAEFGQYLRIVLAQNNQGHMTKAYMNRIVDTKEVLPEVMALLTEDEDGRFYSKRMEVEIVRRIKNQARLLDNLQGSQ